MSEHSNSMDVDVQSIQSSLLISNNDDLMMPPLEAQPVHSNATVLDNQAISADQDESFQSKALSEPPAESRSMTDDDSQSINQQTTPIVSDSQSTQPITPTNSIIASQASLSSQPDIGDSDDDGIDMVFAVKPLHSKRKNGSILGSQSAAKRSKSVFLSQHPPVLNTPSSSTASSAKRAPVSIGKAEAIVLAEDSLDGLPSPAPIARTPALFTPAPSRYKLTPADFDKVTAMRLVLGNTPTDEILQSFLIAAAGNTERAISNFLDTPVCVRHIPPVPVPASLPISNNQVNDQPNNQSNNQSTLDSQTTASSLSSSQSIAVTQSPFVLPSYLASAPVASVAPPRVPASHIAPPPLNPAPMYNGQRKLNFVPAVVSKAAAISLLDSDDDDDAVPFVKPQRVAAAPQPKPHTIVIVPVTKSIQQSNNQPASVSNTDTSVSWRRRALVTIRVAANCTTVGKKVVSPGDIMVFRDQIRESHLNLALAQTQSGAQKSIKRVRAELRKQRKQESRILRFVPACAPPRALEIGSLPRALSDILVPLFDRHLIEIEGQVGADCPLEFDIITNIPLLLTIYATPALFACKPATSMNESKGWVGRVVSAAADGGINPVDSFIALLETFRITPVRSSIKDDEAKLDSAAPIVMPVKQAETDDDDEKVEEPEYEEEIQAAAEAKLVAEAEAAAAAAALLEQPPPLQSDDPVPLPSQPSAAPAEGVQISSFELQALYSSAQNQWRDLPELEPSPRLKASLRAYQKQALYWMTNRERGDEGEILSSTGASSNQGRIRRLHPLWEEYAFEDGTPYYVNPFSSMISVEFPESTGVARGGVLADEMGMGKTVETISLLCYNLPKSSDIQQPEEPSDSDSSSTQPKPRTRIHSTLIVVPMTLMSQWRDEITKFSDLTVLVYYADKRIDVSSLDDYDVIITSYGTLAHEAKAYQQTLNGQSTSKSTALYQVSFHRVILDEAHIIRNRMTEQTKACFVLEATHRWCLTGTPIQNKLDDVFPLLHFLREEPWSEIGWWKRVIERPFQQHDDKALQRLKAVLQPLLLRRTKNMRNSRGEPIVELPPRQESVLRLEFSLEERDFYQALYNQTKTQIDGFVKEGSILNRYIQVLTLILRLRQACDHPFLCLGRARTEDEWADDVNRFIHRFASRVVAQPMVSDDETVPLKRAKGPSIEYIQELHTTIERMRDSQTKSSQSSSQSSLEPSQQSEVAPSVAVESDAWYECPICLSEPEDPVLTECAHVYCRACALQLCGLTTRGRCCICRCWYDMHRLTAIPLPKPKIAIDFEKEFKHSAKTERLMTELAALKRENPLTKSLVFSQWTTMLDLLKVPLQAEGHNWLRLDGSMTQRQRENVLKSFKSDPKVTILLISLKTGGVGLNLVAASCVFFLDCWWNPAVEQQAIDRVHRIGQTKTVRVFRFIVSETVEERILELQQSKMQLAHSVHHDNQQEDNTRVDIKSLLQCFR